MGVKLAAATLISLQVLVVSSTIIDIPGLGKVEGINTKTQWTNQTVYEFRAINYAIPPSGDRRFKYPEKYPGWLETRDATQYGQACPQPGVTSATASLYGQFLSHDEQTLQRRANDDPEDCLTLDVYTKSMGKALRPVFVAIHGGSFLSGMSSSLKPAYMLENDVVLVVPQYRLGPLGFLYLESDQVPGNMGLMDLVVALEWVRDHISVFGGDPDRVTIGGNSAGGASSSLLLFNKRAQGLFHQIIPQSGPALSFWALEKTSGTRPSREMAAKAGCGSDLTPVTLLACLRGKSPTEIVNAYLQYAGEEWYKGQLGMKTSMPVIQSGAVRERIVAQDPLINFESGDYPAKPSLVTIVKHEGIFTLDLIYQFYLTPNNYVTNEEYLTEKLVPDYIEVYGVDDYTRVFSDALIAQYFNAEDVGNFTKMTPALVDLTGMLSHKGPSFKQAHAQAKKADTFLMTLDYYGEHTHHDGAPPSLPVPGGITHSDELIYLYPRTGKPLNEEDTKIAKLMVQIYGNFITTGNVSSTALEGVPAWPPLNDNQRHIMSIRNGGHEMIEDYRELYNTARLHGMVKSGAGSLLPSFYLAQLLLAITALLAKLS